MENATKALLIAAGVLIGMMILSLGVALFYALNGYIEDTQQTMEENALSRFNTQFLKYVNMQPDEHGALQETFTLTIQDIITVANLAYENNKQLGIPDNVDESIYNENNDYVTVNATLHRQDGSTHTIKHLEQNVDEKAAEWLSTYISDIGYECATSDVQISAITGRVYEINFK